jgi:hypothetical protein
MTAVRELDLHKYELESAEWKIAGELCDVMKVCFAIFISNTFEQIFKDATLFFSHSTLNLVTIIPAMDHIDRVLPTSSDTPFKFSPAIRATLAVGKNAIDKYYN